MKQERYVKKALIGAVVAATGLLIAGCSSSSSSGQPSTTSSTSASSTTSSNGHRSGTTTTTATGTVDLPVTDQIRSQLVAAGAAVNDIPVAQYSGLAPGLTYYAFDRSTGTYWAGARLVPAPSSDPSNPTRAQVASQDAGSYYVFSQTTGGKWTAYAAGNVGPGTPCPVTVPPSVLAAWGWPAGGCRPPGQ
jgi:cytoskeletal protein RodZ